jgi:hypothetical protein
MKRMLERYELIKATRKRILHLTNKAKLVAKSGKMKAAEKQKVLAELAQLKKRIVKIKMENMMPGLKAMKPATPKSVKKEKGKGKEEGEKARGGIA